MLLSPVDDIHKKKPLRILFVQEKHGRGRQMRNRLRSNFREPRRVSMEQGMMVNVATGSRASFAYQN
jgi:hypothetical protein